MPAPPSIQQFRLFIALAVPDPIKAGLAEAQDELRHALPAKTARWARREQFHLTLRFLGEVPALQVEELVSACQTACEPFPPLRLSARKLGFFPNARAPRVLWAGIDDAENRLPALWKALPSATQPFTREAPEAEFTGHVTLARLNRLRRQEVEALAGVAAKFAERRFGEWVASQLELMRSELLPEGARHSLLAALPLRGRQAA